MTDLPKGAGTWAGVKANLRDMFWTRLWATCIVFGAGFVVGTVSGVTLF